MLFKTLIPVFIILSFYGCKTAGPNTEKSNLQSVQSDLNAEGYYKEPFHSADFSFKLDPVPLSNLYNDGSNSLGFMPFKAKTEDKMFRKPSERLNQTTFTELNTSLNELISIVDQSTGNSESMGQTGVEDDLLSADIKNVENFRRFANYVTNMNFIFREKETLDSLNQQHSPVGLYVEFKPSNLLTEAIARLVLVKDNSSLVDTVIPQLIVTFNFYAEKVPTIANNLQIEKVNYTEMEEKVEKGSGRFPDKGNNIDLDPEEHNLPTIAKMDIKDIAARVAEAHPNFSFNIFEASIANYLKLDIENAYIIEKSNSDWLNDSGAKAFLIMQNLRYEFLNKKSQFLRLAYNPDQEIGHLIGQSLKTFRKEFINFCHHQLNFANLGQVSLIRDMRESGENVEIILEIKEAIQNLGEFKRHMNALLRQLAKENRINMGTDQDAIVVDIPIVKSSDAAPAILQLELELSRRANAKKSNTAGNSSTNQIKIKKPKSAKFLLFGKNEKYLVSMGGKEISK